MHISDLFASLASTANSGASATAVAEPAMLHSSTAVPQNFEEKAVVIPEVVTEPMRSDSAPSINPLSASTAFFDLYPDINEGPLFRYRPKGIWISPVAIARGQRDWRMFAGDIRRNLTKAGVPLSTVDMVGDPVAIMLGDWGDVRMLQDERGPRVLIRICVPELMGVALSFRRPEMPSTLNAVMENVVDACRRAHGIPKSTYAPRKPTTWTRRAYTIAELLNPPVGKTWY